MTLLRLCGSEKLPNGSVSLRFECDGRPVVRVTRISRLARLISDSNKRLTQEASYMLFKAAREAAREAGREDLAKAAALSPSEETDKAIALLAEP